MQQQLGKVTGVSNADPWKEIEIGLSLFKFYSELVLKAATLNIAVTGGTVSYCLAHQSAPMIKYALIIPLLCSVGFAVLCALGYHPIVLLTREQDELFKRHDMGTPYDFTPLKVLFILFGTMFLLISAGLVALFQQL